MKSMVTNEQVQLISDKLISLMQEKVHQSQNIYEQDLKLDKLDRLNCSLQEEANLNQARIRQLEKEQNFKNSRISLLEDELNIYSGVIDRTSRFHSRTNSGSNSIYRGAAKSGKCSRTRMMSKGSFKS